MSASNSATRTPTTSINSAKSFRSVAIFSNVIWKMVLVTAIAAATLSCGKKNSLYSTDVVISVLPSESVVIPDPNSKVSSCADKVDYQKLVNTGSTTATLGTSVSGPFATFPRFDLSFNGATTDILYVYSLEISSDDEGFGTGGLKGKSIETKEIEAMLGVAASTDGIKRALITGGNSTISSNNSARYTNAAVTYPATCGLVIGGLSLDPKAGAFTARVKVTLLGQVFNTSTQTGTPVKSETYVTLKIP